MLFNTARHGLVMLTIKRLYAGMKCFTSHFIPATKSDVKKLEKILMATQADLDAAIAALPTEIETALAPVIAAIQAKVGTTIDLSAEIASLNAIPAAVAAAITPPTGS